MVTPKTRATAVSTVDLAPDMSGYQLRLRNVVFEPGDVSGMHSHQERSAFSYILEGTLTVGTEDGEGGGRGGKGAGQGEDGRAHQGPDAGPERPATCARPETTSRAAGPRKAIDGALAPGLGRQATPRGIRRPAPRGGSGR